MNWDAIGATGEILGSIGVLATLIYLSLQVRHFNQQTRSESYRSTVQELSSFADLISSSGELSDILVRGRESYTDLSEADQLRFKHIHFRMLNAMESWLDWLEDYGTESDRELHEVNLREIAREYLSSPGFDELWEQSKQMFPREIDEIIKKSRRDA